LFIPLFPTELLPTLFFDVILLFFPFSTSFHLLFYPVGCYVDENLFLSVITFQYFPVLLSIASQKCIFAFPLGRAPRQLATPFIPPFLFLLLPYLVISFSAAFFAWLSIWK